MIWTETGSSSLWLMILLLVHHHLEAHLGAPHHVVHEMIFRPKVDVLLEELRRRVILLGRAAQAMSLSAARQIAQLGLL